MDNSSSKLTVISHIYNEEYLLPFWLEHHSTIFDHGIIIDYCSNDSSIEIIKRFCPTWEIVKTKNLNPDGTPNFQANLIDIEVSDIEQNVNGFRIVLNTTEFLFLTKSKNDLINSLSEKLYYFITSYTALSDKVNFYPKNTTDFFKNINLISKNYRPGATPYRTLHSDRTIKYELGRHGIFNGTNETRILDNFNNFFILWFGYYPFNEAIFKRKLQIQNNIPISDINKRFGHQHIINYEELKNNFFNEINNSTNICNFVNGGSIIQNNINIACDNIKINNIYYSELMLNNDWGENKVIIENDVNLLQNTNFNDNGYKIIDIENYTDLLQRFIKNEIKFITNKDIELKNYHNEISEDEHKIILNAMPYKTNIYPDIQEFCNYLEKTVSNIVNEPVKIFNNDLWIRICRPNSYCNNDYNPCHKDVYLNFYRNIVNIYLPIFGSDENSSLLLQSGSHKWNENETIVTKGGAYFKYMNKKYSVDAIVSSKQPLDMVRPNPKEGQMLLFLPYLIHGCSDNNNDITRISLEVRFIRNDENGIQQEKEFNDFLKIRNWR
jgi:hypothetical protein